MSRHRIALHLNGSFELYQQHRRVIDEPEDEEEDERVESKAMDDPDPDQNLINDQNRISDHNQISEQTKNEVQLEDDDNLPLAEDDRTAGKKGGGVIRDQNTQNKTRMSGDLNTWDSNFR